MRRGLQNFPKTPQYREVSAHGLENVDPWPAKSFQRSKIVIIELDLPINNNEMEFSELTEKAHSKGYLFRISTQAMDKFADGQGFKLKSSFPSPKSNRVVLIYEKNKE